MQASVAARPLTRLMREPEGTLPNLLAIGYVLGGQILGLWLLTGSKVAVSWYRLPRLHRELYGEQSRELMDWPELLHTFHRNRIRRVLDDDYGAVGEGARRADGFVGAHGVSFLTVV